MASAIVGYPACGVASKYSPCFQVNVPLCMDSKVFAEPYRETLKAIIRKIAYDYDIELVELEVPEDHIHMVVRTEPKTAPADVMQIIKSISAREFFRFYPEIKHKYYWGGKLWTQSYFAETIGNANEEVIRQYVQDQLKAMNNGETNSQQLGLF